MMGLYAMDIRVSILTEDSDRSNEVVIGMLSGGLGMSQSSLRIPIVLTG